MSISANVKKAFGIAIAGEIANGHKWQGVGKALSAEYATREAAELVKDAIVFEGIIPHMGEEAVRIMSAEMPRKGSKDWNAASANQQAAWTAIKEAKPRVRAAAEVYYNRAMDYAWPQATTEKGPTAPRDLKTRVNEELAALIKAMQKATEPTFDVGPVIGHLEAALKYVNK